ncbi:hypothetical protein THIAE_01590 [Thiomicrospira aerophila AL3]|uniref:Uncharacterized protein n=1 Tax=Thiomicrospira aerophila AL3 TaxID=717772 RepID=W0DUE9_9GAMM|nr:hypothetical protein THIAE_01590 [Thiomicrospira aerophila AL3]
MLGSNRRKIYYCLIILRLAHPKTLIEKLNGVIGWLSAHFASAQQSNEQGI